MKFKILVLVIFLAGQELATCQENLNDFLLFTQENLEYTALKSFFYIVRQEYVVVKNNRNVETRVGNDYYGKLYTLGVLGEDTNLWLPAYIRYPWEMDYTFDKKNDAKYKAECSITRFKSKTDIEYYSTKIHWQESDDLILSLKIGRKDGIALEETWPDEGTLFVFSTSTSSPDAFGDIEHSIIYLDDIAWDSAGIAEADPLDFGNERILGGALFSRYIEPGNVRWKLSGMYIILDDKWVLKSISDTH